MKNLILNITPTEANICKKLGVSVDEYKKQLKKKLTEELQGKSLEEILEEHPCLVVEDDML